MKLNSILIPILLCQAIVQFGQKTEHPLLDSFRQYQQAKEESLFHLQTIPVGPALNSARVEAVQLDPTKPGTMYVAFGSGNLWKTTDHGVNWKPIFENQAAQGIGDIAIAPSNTNIIYVGTGESLRKNRNFTMPGTGMYRSDDGGKSWKHLGLWSVWHIGEIAVHPQNPDIVFVAAMGRFWSPGTNKGIYRSMDGGEHWEKVLYVDENTRANDIVISTSKPDVIYASMWENNINRPLRESVYGANSSIYKSTDGGLYWEKMDNGLPKGSKTGRIGLAVSHQDPDKVYALIDNLNRERALATEVYKTTDGGTIWTRTHQEDQKFLGTIGWYFSDIYVNPEDDEEIFGLGIRVAHSTDGGRTFEVIGGNIQHINPSPAQTLHLDQCELWINPLNPRHLALGNDGGLYISYDKGKNWTHFNNIPAGEFYTITLDNEEPYRIFGGAQDDATVFGIASEYDPLNPDPWKYLWIDAWSGGDGCMTQVDPNDPNTVYFSMQNGFVLRRDMMADTSKRITNTLRRMKRDLHFNFVAPYFISPHQSNTLYLAGNYVFKSNDRGDLWKVISPDLGHSDASIEEAYAVGALAESPIRQGLIFAGTDKGAFWCSKDDGEEWLDFSKGLPKAYIRSIAPSKYSESRVYIAMTGLNYDDLNSYIFISEDYGENWISISGNLPNEPANVVLEDPFYENVIYVGTHRGVFISLDKGQLWQLFSTAMPAVSVSDLKIQEREKDLVVATHGRGIYKIKLKTLYQALEKGWPPAEDILYDVESIHEPKRRDTHNDVDLQSIEKLDISFYLKERGMVQIGINSHEGKEITSWDYEGKKGLNQFRWDLVIKKNESLEPYFTKYKEYLEAGAYSLQVHTKTRILSKEFNVRQRF